MAANIILYAVQYGYETLYLIAWQNSECLEKSEIVGPSRVWREMSYEDPHSFQAFTIYSYGYQRQKDVMCLCG
jgi:hypothetical protein